MRQTAQSGGVNRFDLRPRPPSPPPPFLGLPWWLRWPIAYAVVGVLYSGWVFAIMDAHDRTVSFAFAAPYFATPMVVLVLLRVRSRSRSRVADAPRAFAWGAGLSLVSIFLFTFGYAGWPFMFATTPAALALLVYALVEPPRHQRGRAAVVSLAVVLVGFALGFADLSGIQSVAGWVVLSGGITLLVWLARHGR